MNRDKLLTILYVLGGLLLVLELTIMDDFSRSVQVFSLVLMILIPLVIVFLEIRKKWFQK